MKKHVYAIAAGVLMALGGTAQAAEKSTTFVVSAEVTTNCVISAEGLNLGVFDGSNDLTQTSDITVACTNGTAYDVNLSAGGSGDVLARELSNGVQTLVYNLYTDGSYGTVWGDETGGTGRLGGTGTGMANAQTLVVYGRLLASDNAGAIDVGTYTDTITATIVY
jgi:spore coat protein U-like protein